VSFVLSGNYTVPAVFTLPLTQIAAVETFIAGCYQHWEITDPMAGGTFVLSSGGIADITPSACVAGATGAAGPEIIRVFPLTYTNVPGGPVPVVAGQIVTVSVIISFS